MTDNESSEVLAALGWDELAAAADRREPIRSSGWCGRIFGEVSMSVQMRRSRRVAWTLSLVVLFATGALGLYNGLRELGYALTPLQRSVSIGVLVYGVLGVVAGIALAARHRSSAWLAAMWGAVITYVASVAAIAYAGADATVVGAVASGIASAVIAVGVVWTAHVSAELRDAGEPRARARGP